MLKPLEQFRCDNCGQLILQPSHGCLEWIFRYDDNKHKSSDYGFKIVHLLVNSPYKDKTEYGCSHYTEHRGKSLMYLTQLLENPLPYLLTYLDAGPYHLPEFKETTIVNMREYVEIFRRLTIPYYEEARIYWDKAKDDGYFHDANEVGIYLPKTLKRLIEKYGEN